MVYSPDATIYFFAQLTQILNQKRSVYVSLRYTRRIDHDTIAVLLSIMVRFKEQKIDFNGDFPKTSAAHRILIRSRFFEMLYSKDFRERETYSIGQESTIKTHAKRQVDPPLSAMIVDAASRTIWGNKRRVQGVQRIFLELMHNTNNHASHRQGEKFWWVSTNHKVKARKVSFSFVDFGVGVFNSLNVKGPESKWHQWQDKLPVFYTDDQHPELLRLIMNGELHQTVTNQYFRGKGLPGLKQVLARNWISKLVVVTNNVYADVGADVYRLLDVPFDGTFIYWEVDKLNRSCMPEGDDE